MSKASRGRDAAAQPKYLTAADLAALCQVDHKTIHNWAKRDLPHFRTAGGHLRFKPREIVPWLRKHGYDVPRELCEAAKVDVETALEPAGEEVETA